ncbi:golgin subfamily A member 6-like protein 22 [Temnothorax curvispinosus]|uniref:Golgin subfamily A member 6-like protein 22 n=1 Tax=Temnothorax curvispinosus TaxID=300111 RepID=A0A6J1RBA8_9HYME|nr:golgin subfamily A member 6-like protein 22 [Temnothorax curvispinosus]
MSDEKESGTEMKEVIDKGIDKVKEKYRGRRGSTGSMGTREENSRTLDEIWKRKRDDLDKSGGGEEKEIVFKRSNMTTRSPKKKAETKVGEKEIREIINKNGEEGRGNMEAEELLRKILRKMEKQEGLKEELRRSEAIWRKQREALEEKVKKLEEKVEERIKRVEEKIRERKGKEKGEIGNGNKMRERMKELERRLERKEKEERRRNIVIRGLEVKEGGRRQEAEKLEGIGAKVKAIEVKRIRGNVKKGREMVLLKLENEQKWEVMEKKRSLVGRKERIMEDLTWEERRTNWILRELARREEREGKRAWIKAGRIRLENVWWSWDMEEEVLKDERGMIRKESGGEKEEGGKVEGGGLRMVTGEEEGRGEELKSGNMEGKGEEEGKSKFWRVVFWSVAGLKNKDKDFWEALKKKDVLVMVETWIGEKGWERIRGRLPRGYKWGVQMAKRKNKKERAIGGIIMGIRKGFKEKGTEIETDREGLIAGKVRIGGERWSIIRVYAKKEEIEESLQELGHIMERKEKRRFTIIGRDFNARTGREGGSIEEEEGGGWSAGERRSKDKKIDKERRLLVYTAILAEKLREEIEGKRIVPQNQTGFRRGMGTIDNIFVLNYLVNRRLEKKGGKLIACFVDLKASLDLVDRGVLIKSIREREIREGLVRKTEEILRETRSRVRVGDELGEKFWTGRGVRQGCPLSSLLFNVLLADMEQEVGRAK